MFQHIQVSSNVTDMYLKRIFARGHCSLLHLKLNIWVKLCSLENPRHVPKVKLISNYAHTYIMHACSFMTIDRCNV